MSNKLNKIVQMDCLEYLKSLPDECVECVLIDEPYMILKGHKIEESYNLDIAKQVRIEALRVLKKDGWFIFFGVFPSAWDFGRITMEVGFKPWQQCNEIVWCKRKMSSPFNKISRIHENIFVFQKGSPQIYENKAPMEDILIPAVQDGVNAYQNLLHRIAELKARINGKQWKAGYSKGNCVNDQIHCVQSSRATRIRADLQKIIPSIWSFSAENRMHIGSHNIKHPTVKPVLLFRRLIKLFTKQGDTVLDCFSGSGTTALACLQEGRNFLCCERDGGYVKIANDRLADWKEDLLRQDKLLNDRGAADFESDIRQETQQGSLL